jgi:hypothetical protein
MESAVPLQNVGGHDHGTRTAYHVTGGWSSSFATTARLAGYSWCSKSRKSRLEVIVAELKMDTE